MDDEARTVLQKERDNLAGHIENAELLMAYLLPEFDKFKAKPRIPYNLYVVRMYVDHMSSVRRNRKLLDALDSALSGGGHG